MISRPHLGSKGFTLVEVMVAIAILVSITALMWATMSGMFSSREYFEGRYERMQIVRASMGRMATEIASAYVAGPGHGGEELPGQERDQSTLSEEELQALNRRQPIQFGFIGREDRLDFTAFAHVRTQVGERNGRHAEIGYFMRREKSEETGELVRQLVRREDTTYDGRLERGGTIFVLVPEIEEIEFEYWDGGPVRVGTLEEIAEGRWVREWDTTRREFAGRLPTRVKITITLPPLRQGGEAEQFVIQTQLGTTEVLEF